MLSIELTKFEYSIGNENHVELMHERINSILISTWMTILRMIYKIIFINSVLKFRGIKVI